MPPPAPPAAAAAPSLLPRAPRALPLRPLCEKVKARDEKELADLPAATVPGAVIDASAAIVVLVVVVVVAILVLAMVRSRAVDDDGKLPGALAAEAFIAAEEAGAATRMTARTSAITLDKTNSKGVSLDDLRLDG